MNRVSSMYRSGSMQVQDKRSFVQHRYVQRNKSERSFEAPEIRN